MLLGVNIDHVATLRNARGGFHPDPLRAADLGVSTAAIGETLRVATIGDYDAALAKLNLKKLLQALPLAKRSSAKPKEK